MWPSGCDKRRPICRGRLSCSVLRWRAGPRLVPDASTPRVRCSNRQHVGLSATHATGWGYRYHVPRATALAMRGSTGEAAAVLARLDELRRPFRSLDYERSLARAWVAAGQGAVTEAITVALSAAERASAKGQFAAEVFCLQTATQFGDHSGAPRLAELASIVEGPRVGVAARFAAALHDGDPAELASVSGEFERMGDLVAAADAAAHAALVYRRQGLRGSALGCCRHARMPWRNNAAT